MSNLRSFDVSNCRSQYSAYVSADFVSSSSIDHLFSDVQMSGISQGANSMMGVAGELDGQSFSLGTASKDQRVNKEALLKMTRNKRQTANKTPGPT